MTWKFIRRYRARLSKIEDNGEEKHRSETSIFGNFDASNERIETGALATNRRGQRGIERGNGVCYHGKQKYSVREKIVAVSGTTKISVQNRHQNPKESQRPNEVHLGSLLVNRADITSKVSARDHLVIMGIQPNVNSTKQNRDAHL